MMSTVLFTKYIQSIHSQIILHFTTSPVAIRLASTAYCKQNGLTSGPQESANYFINSFVI
jgi:hypothetical protein